MSKVAACIDQVISLPVQPIAAAEAAVAIAIIINLYRSHGSIDVESAEELKN